ncbi:MAG: hypothetical protein EOS09_07860 [Mesorhizobium sp.]|nr:MAG: hypothetical protein EOS09_07860 [Mesorhizobium sp.]
MPGTAYSPPPPHPPPPSPHPPPPPPQPPPLAFRLFLRGRPTGSRRVRAMNAPIPAINIHADEFQSRLHPAHKTKKA